MQTTVEFFCGIGGFRIAADAAGLETVWANDLDARACQVYRARFGGPLHEGDVSDFLDGVPAHDVLTGGFPCQPFSSAGKKQGVRDPRGTLFQALARTIERRQPRFFVLENVKRLLKMEQGCHFATILSELAGLGYRVEWRVLNALHFGLAQNRERVILVGTRDPAPAEGGYLAPPADFLRPDGADLERVHERKHWEEIEKHGVRFGTWGLAEGARFVSLDGLEFSAAKPRVTLERVLEPKVPELFDFTKSMEPRLSRNAEVNRFVDGVEIISNQNGGARMGYTVFGIRGLAPTLTAATSRHYERYKVGKVYRRLTNVEYARLQGFPDSHCACVSVYDQYSLYGNAVPPPMMEWVLRRLVTCPEAGIWHGQKGSGEPKSREHLQPLEARRKRSPAEPSECGAPKSAGRSIPDGGVFH
jgi:DNA (cytosine-5)-methyltransferase 1